LNSYKYTIYRLVQLSECIEIMQCEQNVRDRRCKAKAMKGSNFCVAHTLQALRDRPRCKAIVVDRAKVRPCKNYALKDTDKCALHSNKDGIY
jgi:hypothetical protein